MKTRNGFVSNSSSSSFIIAIGKVIDKKKALSFFESCGLDCSYNIKKLSEIRYKFDINDITNNKLIIYGISTNSKVELDLDTDILNENNEILIVGQYHHIDFDESKDDFSLSKYFSISEVKLYNGLNEENGFVNVDKKFGRC
jgi:hypothetical protein